jgi:Concanavalin A-like lectin/glucanases superfamily
MATVTGLTAERMLEIEAASVVDGDVVGNDLFLSKHDGSLINAGNVRGPSGPVGPMGQALSVITAQQILDVGQPGQIRAGRQLTLSDFTNMGLGAPAGLWNLSNFNDSSGNGRGLTNKGSVPLGVGINGLASTAAVFAGSTSQALYIADTGAADPFRIRTGSFGCWFRTAKRGTTQGLISKWGITYPANDIFVIQATASNVAVTTVIDTVGVATATGTTDVCDDRWHFVVATVDGTVLRMYVDGILEGISACGVLQFTSAPFNIGSQTADASTTSASPNYGRIDEAFVTSDILSPDQVRMLYCASIPHSLGFVPVDVSLSVLRKRRGSIVSPSDFPSPPLRLYNFSGGSLADQGTNGVALSSNPGTGAIMDVAGADGVSAGGKSFLGAHGGLSATDAGLPGGLSTRSYGCWFKGGGTSQGLFSWGSTSGVNSDSIWFLNPTAALTSRSAGASADDLSTTCYPDGQWHHVVVVCDNAANDGLRRKIYLDGKLAASSTILNSITLSGANRFRVGSFADGSLSFVGQIDGAFVHGSALTGEQIRSLYNIGSQALASSPKDSSDHVESMEAARLLAVFDSVESSDLVNLAVSS